MFGDNLQSHLKHQKAEWPELLPKSFYYVSGQRPFTEMLLFILVSILNNTATGVCVDILPQKQNKIISSRNCDADVNMKLPLEFFSVKQTM